MEERNFMSQNTQPDIEDGELIASAKTYSRMPIEYSSDLNLYIQASKNYQLFINF